MKLLVSALEHSANVHLKSLKKELHEDVELMGIFDKELGEPIIDLQSLAIMGIVDALKKLRFFFKLANEMVELSREADKVLLMDSSGFNLPLAKKIKKKYPEKEIIYYILPQAWAWKKKRIPVLAKTIDRLCSILPFEPDYYPKDAPIEYVGHPLLDQIKTFKESLSPEIKHITFMPGSRKGEIKRLMPIYKELRERINVQKATVIIPEYFSPEDINELYGDLTGFEVVHNAHVTLNEADFAFICSGTATLEAALIGTPFILAYKAKPLDYFIGSRVVKLSHVGLANIMFEKFKGEEIHPEFLQDAVTAKNLLESYKNYDTSHFLENSKALRAYLQHGSAKRVAQIIQE
ncbi:lipid-A-disaccharide synthase [Sulfurimonas paralvinellae]|uniref:Lipid-A-disaccharide synthase n=1 Tax=Sulfurimonas paralvinellae TaxID=317658 RepID=A0A7M1B755_9BACT|nr:lipid-A-disaccharide synthase [Sulfurimonas paralvinellae]QOP45521.1 lipid-A-disaccharide synthase [Sulfurimonas paralvinellae]